jgi:hypothetical protein
MWGKGLKATPLLRSGRSVRSMRSKLPRFPPRLSMNCTSVARQAVLRQPVAVEAWWKYFAAGFRSDLRVAGRRRRALVGLFD